MNQRRAIRRRFLIACWQHLHIVWPVLSTLVALQLAIGALIGLLEGWPFGEGAWFSFVTSLTIGYGDVVPLRFVSRIAAVLIGFIGVLTTGLVAAVGVQSLQHARGGEPPPQASGAPPVPPPWDRRG